MIIGRYESPSSVAFRLTLELLWLFLTGFIECMEICLVHDDDGDDDCSDDDVDNEDDYADNDDDDDDDNNYDDVYSEQQVRTGDQKVKIYYLKLNFKKV